MRRKPRVVWLPPTNANSIGDLDDVFQVISLDLTPGPGGQGTFVVGELPLTIDGDQDPLSITSSLADIENAGYRLRRIVGKIWVKSNLLDVVPLGAADELAVTAGIIVRRIDPATGTSLASLDVTGDAQNPGAIRNSMDPWIWRRSWLLFHDETSGAFNIDNFTFASNTTTGCGVDQKTARIVGPEERLFLNVSVTALSSASEGITNVTRVTTDLRVLASMRANSGNRRNASR